MRWAQTVDDHHDRDRYQQSSHVEHYFSTIPSATLFAMRKEGWATTVSSAFAVALTVTPGIQKSWLALIAWAITAWAGWRWYSHREPEDSTPQFNGQFFVRLTLKRGTKPDWLDVQVVTIAVSFGHVGDTVVSMQLTIVNRSKDWVAKLKFFLADSYVSEGSGKMTVVAAARKYDVVRREMPDTPGFSDVLYSPLTVSPGTNKGNLWFLHPSRQFLPFASLVVEDVMSKAMWSVSIDSTFSKAVADNPTLALLWPGSDAPIVVIRDGQLYRLT